ncbi:phytanoyl-CoA dioxygenase family protein [Halobacteriovorax sp. HLS]|uniref:phytanoyl-CoA dioxygenase family protein n=1 Tax=Halobacteriovorax sp. HLS TaxID=2234000 RepID=UPI0019D4B0DC|nr:phytanoyl-CoA dioxygenase family protein [Halobacteriovorax sp. HLS]
MDFFFKPLTPAQKLKNSLLHIDSHIRSLSCPPSSKEQRKISNQLSKDGYVILHEYLSEDLLGKAQAHIKNSLEYGNFEFPVFAQSNIDKIKHKEIIDNHFLESDEHLFKMGLAFDKEDFTNLDEVVQTFKPSIFKIPFPSQSAEFSKIWLDEFILGVINCYMGLTPKLLEAYIRRNYPSEFKRTNHYWHRDLNHRSHLLKVFIFFSDCTIDNGPHEYIRGSHKDLTINGKRFFEEKEVDKIVPPDSSDRIKSIVKAGTIVIEDTRGLHRAIIPKKGYRDLGFAVFAPVPTYSILNTPCYYNISKDNYNRLSDFQKKFIPKGNILEK